MTAPRFSSLWALWANQPELLAQHARCYGQLLERLVKAELQRNKRAAVRKMLLVVLLLMGLWGVTMALMLWTVSAPLQAATLAVLGAIAVLPWLAALVLCLWPAPAATPSAWGVLMGQFKADWALLQDLSEPAPPAHPPHAWPPSSP